MRQKKVIAIVISFLLCINLVSCKKKSAEENEDKKKTLNIYVDIKDKNTLNIIKFLTEEYKKANPKSELKINDVLGGGTNIIEDISKGTEADLVLTSRNTMIELAQKGLLSDMSQQFEKNKISEKYYNIVAAYGRIGEKYYGIGVIPYTVEFFYNTDAINKLGINPPGNIQDALALMKKLNSSNIKVPIVVTEDLDINCALSSIIASNKVKASALDTAYDNNEVYKNIKEMQGIFDDINTAVKETGINKSFFELGNENTLAYLTNGSIPFVISTSYYYNNLKESNIKLIEEFQLGNGMKGNMPVIINALLCMPTNSKNSEDAGKFIKFLLSDETQENIVKKGYISGSKKANAELLGLGESIVKHLSNANDNSIVYIYNLPKKFQKHISGKVDSILAGKYTKNEWQEILNEVY
ncbi:extracellular solute-binding protein [Clostridium sp. SYSU_GA19001]|uniref:ABC transporter substrate-binding protein n=1 Tax=Clostridium caldaquaticum TaxID=2940653 RepID=UPI0020774319|nr:extracellular solute-binding protein [Clostridium caldaquaticum]MCM8709790.1 extracellular solute-binding protein [Clostridium caldaquaticum]